MMLLIFWMKILAVLVVCQEAIYNFNFRYFQWKNCEAWFGKSLKVFPLACALLWYFVFHSSVIHSFNTPHASTEAALTVRGTTGLNTVWVVLSGNQKAESYCNMDQIPRKFILKCGRGWGKGSALGTTSTFSTGIRIGVLRIDRISDSGKEEDVSANSSLVSDRCRGYFL